MMKGSSDPLLPFSLTHRNKQSMSTLNLYKERQTHTVILEVDGEPKEFKIPKAYTVEEVERLLEIQVDLDLAANQTVEENKADKQVEHFFDLLFSQLLVLFSRYHSELTVQDLKKYLSREEAQRIILFHTQEQLMYIVNEGKEETKKKVRK